MNKNSSAAMIIKTIATDRQLDTRKSSPTRRTTQTVIEKSYLRSQFERRQRRQIELTNKMHQQPAEREHPDLVASSHELAKRRFFDQLERRESINSARASQQQTGKAAQLHQRPHQQRPTQAGPNENGPAECAIKVDVNEPDGAGTDADEATSLETIITNNSSRPNETLAAAPQNGSCKVPPLDNSNTRDDQQVQQVELRVVGTSVENDRGEPATCRLEEAADAEQTSELLAQELQSGRQPSKGDLRDRPQPIADQEEHHERLRPFSLSQQQQQLGQQEQQREQYANPRPSPLDSAQGSHENRSRGNNVNHDQYDGHHEILNNSQAPQVFAGMQFEDEKEGINLLGHDSVGPATVDLLQQRPFSFKSPDSESVQDHEVGDEHENGEQMCDTVQRCPPFLMSATMNRAQEEDVRSSCSSSGFGASVSAGSSASSSSEGQPERNRHHHHYERHLQTKDKDYGREHEVGSSVQYEAFPLSDELHLSQLDKKKPDEIGQFEIFVGRLDGNTADLDHQTLSVGLERAHETNDERPMLHVENHGYGSLGNNERLMTMKTEADSNCCNKTKTMRNQTDKRRWPLVNPGDFTSELELDSSSRQYVNLPAASNDSDNQNSSSSYNSMGAAAVSSVSAAAGYATVRARPTSLVSMHSRGQAGAGLANIPPAGNNGHSATTSHGHNPGVLAKVNRRNSDEAARSGELEDCGSHLSGHNSSTSSASSGGFSKLPPVRLIDHNFANNFESSSSSSKAPLERESSRTPSAHMEENNSVQQHQLQSRKSASLLKRFGSLVSRAFTSSNNFGEFNGDGIRSSAKNSGAHCAGGQKSAQVNGARLETTNQPCSTSSAIPPLKQQNGSRESTNGISRPPLQAHKSIETATGGHKEDHHQDHHANQNRGQKQKPSQMLEPPDQGAFVGAAGKSLVMAEADLVILSSKHSRNNYQAPRNKTTTAAVNDYHAPKSRRNTMEFSRGLGEKVSGKVRRCSSRNEQQHHHHHSNRSGQLTRETSADAFLRRRSASSASCSSFTSLDNSSLTCSSTQDLSQRERAALGRRRTRRERLHNRIQRRASSLSDELESLISPSELGSQRAPVGETHLMSLGKCDESCTKLSQRPSTITASKTSVVSRSELTAAANCESSSPLAQVDCSPKSSSIMRWFSVNGSSPAPVATNDDRNSIQYEPSWRSRESRQDDLRSSRDRYHDPKSFISHSHANGDCKLNCSKANRNFAILSSKLQKGSRKGANGSPEVGEAQPISLAYSSLNLPPRSQHGDNESRQQRSNRLERINMNKDLGDKLGEDELVVNDGKCQSLNLYQNLLRNYVKRRNHHHRHHRHHNRDHHNHHHHHHHHHHQYAHSSHHHNRSSSSRHAHCPSSSAAATTTRCGQQQRCVSPVGRACSCSSDQLDAAGHGKTHGDTASVWGQLIEINKSDGSQVIELQRAPGRSWGFFVARGAINNKKGIFISRVHSSSSGGRPLNGLLSVGDRILSIDNYLIEPDFDILQVNQIISKKSKIFLEVKPFKG